MIEKMKFLSISGPKDDIDRVVETYLSKYEIHLEHALTELKTVKNLQPYVEANPYKEILQKSEGLVELLGGREAAGNPSGIPVEEAARIIEKVSHEVLDLKEKNDKLSGELKEMESALKKILPFKGLNYDVSTILKFEHIKFRFGRIAKENMENFEKYVYDNIDTIFIKCAEDEEYISGVYFVPAVQEQRIDAIYASMHFERFFLPDDYPGTPSDAVAHLQGLITEAKAAIKVLEDQTTQLLADRRVRILEANERLEIFAKNFDIRKMAACTKDKENIFYILGGWMTENQTKALLKEVENDEALFCIVEDDHNNVKSSPPTKLKNPKIFKPFEMFIRMYGLPGYHELDPTILVAITYSFLFGFMFGDVGQGLCLVAGGYLLYHFKKSNLAAIISCAGVFSTIFGFLFGSIFGFEGVIEPLWLHPTSHMTNLPFIGSLNTVFVVAVALGMAMILFTMILHIRNALRVHDKEGLLFDSNGVAGLVFYGAVTAMVVLFMTGNRLPGTLILLIMFLVPLLVIGFKEPLTALVEKKAEVMPKKKGMFFVQMFFELFELLLSYFSNTLSFVRVGAFAVSHAAMMSVVLMLAGAENGGNPNILVIIVGNLFVVGMEGLIVGIQVLRLEYYEIFSRFYKGGGREFKPYTGKKLISKAQK